MTDAINLHDVVYHQSPNVADWPITCALAGVEFRDADPAGGVRPIANVTWPDVVPDGWDGPITHCIWIVRQIGTVWHGAAVLEFYRGKVWTGAPLHTQYHDWVNKDRGFGELADCQNLIAGERVGFLLTAGSQRLKDTSTQRGGRSVRERSNVIVVPFSPNGIVMAATGAQETETTTTGTTDGSTSAAIAALIRAVEDVRAALVVVQHEQGVQTALTDTLSAQWLAQADRLTALETRVAGIKVPTEGVVNVFGQRIKVKLQ